jgi:hypothetical protein
MDSVQEVGDQFENALREAQARKAEAEVTASAADLAAKAKRDAADALAANASRLAASLLPLAAKMVEELQGVGRMHIDRGARGALEVHRGSPPLPKNMGLWGCDRLWHGGRRGGWVVRTRHPRSADFVPIFVPLSGSAHVRVPVGNGSRLPSSLQDFVIHGYSERTSNPSEGLPERSVVDANTSLGQFIDVVADYIVVVG